ncbi:hypothetical protein CDL12_16594 [Handroanthus impetiginosus]|uniref:Transcription repressor n=1 Tax=Handroanthus impetiginosus TaxID=429701 RepID=A0A2G9GZZ2_9LAMI|nr:hypothetical protein CDL12_16594 [Handroanthus impetiginosus]
MSKQIQKSIHECLSKIKVSNKQIQFQLRGCKRSKSPSSAAAGKEKENASVTLSDVDQFLFENFRSLYQKEYEEETSKKNETKTASFLFESPRLLGSPPPENLCGSARFFVASGSTSSLIIDEGPSSSASGTNDSPAPLEESEQVEAKEEDSSAPDDFIALLTYSPNPYEDFRRSMQEMVEARMEHNGKVDWEFLQELLFCYLDLNNKKSYRFILRAFVDLIVVLRENSGRVPASRRPWKGEAERRRLN